MAGGMAKFPFHGTERIKGSFDVPTRLLGELFKNREAAEATLYLVVCFLQFALASTTQPLGSKLAAILENALLEVLYSLPSVVITTLSASTRPSTVSSRILR